MSRAAGVALAAASFIVLAGSAACGGGTSSEPASASGTPVPPGVATEVKAWRAAQTWLVGQRPIIEAGEVQAANSWRVTLVSAASCIPSTGEPPGAPPAEPPAPPAEPPAAPEPPAEPPAAPGAPGEPPAEPPAAPGEPSTTAQPSPAPGGSPLTGATHHCVLLAIENPAADPALLDLGADGPVLVTPDGTRHPVAGVRLATGPFAMVTMAGQMTSASTCTFSAPDAEGRQAADCATILVAKSNGTTFEEALAAIGAGKAVELELAFDNPGAAGDAILEWPGGVRFAAWP